MSANSDQILKEALALSVEERAELLEQLLATFQSPPDARTDELWVRESEDRLDAYERGELNAVSEQEVLSRIRLRRSK